jgi:predicted permease
MHSKAAARLRSFARALLLRSRMEREMDEEMRFHIEAFSRDLEGRGVPHAEAERRARAEFGDVVRWKEAGREARGLGLADDLRADLRYAVRMMRRAPGFTAAAVISLTLGIGAATTIFGLLDVLVLRPLPVRAAGELVHVTTGGERGPASSGSSNDPWYREVASRTDLFADAMLVRHGLFKVGINGAVEPIMGARATLNYYALLGVPAVLGRTFAPADRAGNDAVAVISYGLWQRRFGGRADVIGASITVDQRPYTVVGVTGRDFRGILVGWTTDVAMPLDTAEFLDPHNWTTTPLIARVKPGADVAHLAAQLDPALQRMVATGVAERFRRRYLERVVVESAASGISDLREPFSRPLRLLMAAVALLLLIACVNLAGLLVARNAARQHELGMRLALGAARSRLVRQLLTESAALAMLGAVPGVLLAVAAGNLLIAFMPPFFGPLSLSVRADWRVLAFAVAATTVTTLLFGILPAWQAARAETWQGITRTSTRTATARVHVGRALVVGQFALSLVLVAGAALFIRTVLNLSQVETGFDRDHALVVQIDPHGTSYENDRLRQLQHEMLAAFAALPGVRYATLSTSSPFNGNMDGKRLTVPGFVPSDADDGVIQVNLVGPDYFSVFAVPILRGRPIDARDRAGAPAVAVASESFARRYFGDAAAAIGRQFTTGRGETARTFEIVGVAGDVRYQDLRAPSERLVYLSWFQADDVRLAPFEFVLRTEGNPANLMNMARAELQRLHPAAPVAAIRTMSAVIVDRLLSERLLATLSAVFALIALTLAAVGVFGLQAHAVARRVPEYAVRLALGGRPGQMMWMTIRENLRLVSIGAIIGVAAALAGLRLVNGLLFGLSATDGGNLLGAAAILVLVSLSAAIVPARRAASVDPLVALRSE